MVISLGFALSECNVNRNIIINTFILNCFLLAGVDQGHFWPFLTLVATPSLPHSMALAGQAQCFSVFQQEKKLCFT